MLMQYATLNHLMALVTGRMRKFWEEVVYFDLTEIYTHNPIADWHRIFNLRPFLGESDSWIYLDWINIDYFSDLY